VNTSKNTSPTSTQYTTSKNTSPTELHAMTYEVHNIEVSPHYDLNDLDVIDGEQVL
jgi:hypothetical protein